MLRWNFRSLIHAATFAATGALALSANSAGAVDRVKADNADNLTLTTSWVGGVAPTPTDVAVWNSTVTGPNTTILGANLTVAGLRITNPGGPVTINAGSQLNILSGGLDMSTATQDFISNLGTSNTASGVALGTATEGSSVQTWNIASGRTATFAWIPIRNTAANNISNGSVVNLTGTGSLIFTNALSFPVVRDGGNNPYMTINKNDWAGTDAAGLVVPATYTEIPEATAMVAGANNDIKGNVTSGTTDVTSVRFSNDLAPANITLGGGNTGTMRGVLMTETSMGGQILNGFIRPSRASTAGATMSFIQHSTLGDLTVTSSIANASSNTPVSITKSGVGKMILAGANGYTGVTHIHEGTLQVGNGGTAGALASTAAIVNNGAFIVNRSDAVALNNVISGTGSVTQAGTGTLTLGGANTYTGATHFNGGSLGFSSLANLGNGTALNFNGGSALLNAAIDISTRTVTVAAGGGGVNTNGLDVTFANPIGNGGAGGFAKRGAGTLTLNAANTYTGVTTAGGGTLRVNGSVLGGALVESGGTLGGTGSITGTTIVNAGGTLAPGNSVGTLTTSALTLDAGSLLDLEFGAGVNDRITTSTLNGLTINGGAISLFQDGSLSAFSTPGTYTIATFAGAIQGTGLGSLSIANPTAGFAYAFGTSAGNLNLTITTSGTLANWVINGGGSWNNGPNWSTNPTIPNAVGAAARFNTALTSPATVTLDGNKTVAGVLFSSNNGYTIATGSGGSLTLQNAGAAPTNLDATSGSHTISAGVQLASNTVAHAATGATITVSGAVGGAGSLTNADNGTLVLSNVANSYGGGTTLELGTLQFAADGSLGTGGVTFSGGALRYASGNTADISSRVVTFSSGQATIDTNGNNVAYANAVGNNGAGGLTKAGAGTLTMLADNTYTGPTNVTGGTLSISANGQLGVATSGAAVTISNGATLESTAAGIVDLDADGLGANARALTIGAGGGTIRVADPAGIVNVRGVMNGSGSLTKTGDGNLFIGIANNFFTGGTLIQGGSVTIGDGGALGTGTITLQGGTLIENTFTPLNVIHVVGSGTVRGGSSGGTQGLRNVTGSGTLTLENNVGVFDIEGDLTGFNGSINFTNAGAGGYRFFGSTGAASAAFNLVNSGISNRQGSPQITFGSLTGDVASTLTGSNATGNTEYIIGARNESTEFAGIISDSATGPTSITKVGTGTLTLSNFNTYLGVTRISQGAISYTQPSLNSLADVAITTGGILNLNFDINITGPAFVDSLFLNGISQVAGEYGAIGSGAQFTTPFITGTGRVNVLTYDLPGDFDNSGTVDAADLDVWKAGRVANNATGDTDADGDTDGSDFLIWQRFLGATVLTVGAGAAVPEPSMLALVALALPALVGAGRRRRS
jgi:fibronectin-binding autotransporter adhesin